MLLRVLTSAAVLLGAAPNSAEQAQSASAARASKAAKAPASAKLQSEQPQACVGPPEGTAKEISDEEWKEFIRKKIAESEQEKPEPVDPDPFAFSVYRGQRPESMGEQTIINGARMEIATLVVPVPPRVVEQEYYETFTRMGFRPMTGDVPRSPGVRYLSFRPTGSKKLKTVTLVPSSTGTVILASVGNPEELLVKKPELPGGLPVPPNSQTPSSIQQTEPGAGAQSAFFVVRDSTPEKVIEFYHQELAKRGFAPVPNATSRDAESFEKDGVMLTLSAKPHTDPNTVAVSLVWIE